MHAAPIHIGHFHPGCSHAVAGLCAAIAMVVGLIGLLAWFVMP